jgi:uncharacterized membrane protein
MTRKILALAVAGALAVGATAAPAFADPPGPGESRNGKCVGKPSDRIGGCK